jgi:Cys-rich repeat protein
VVCLVAADCPHAGDACDPSGFCSDPCSTSTQCTSGSKAHCDPNSGACVECLEASHCSDEPYCILGRCAECTQSSECAAKSPDKPFCGVLHQCVECLRDADCASGICDLNEGHCKGG